MTTYRQRCHIIRVAAQHKCPLLRSVYWLSLIDATAPSKVGEKTVD